MSRLAFLTPDAHDPADVLCRTIRIPNAPDWLGLVAGALAVLTHEWNYEEYGTATPEECAVYFSQALAEMAASLGGCMIGQLLYYATAAPPERTLPCDGSIHNRVDYPLLYAALHSRFIIDEDLFETPDLRERFAQGAISDGYIGVEGGDAEHTLTVNEMPAHGHGTLPHSHTTVGLPTPDLIGAIPGPSMQALPSTTGLSGVTILETGGGAAHNNVPPYVVIGIAIVAE